VVDIFVVWNNNLSTKLDMVDEMCGAQVCAQSKKFCLFTTPLEPASVRDCSSEEQAKSCSDSSLAVMASISKLRVMMTSDEYMKESDAHCQLASNVAHQFTYIMVTCKHLPAAMERR
jgi:hypothetical protein